MSSSRKNLSIKLLALIIFGIAFGFVEATVVYYLRHLLNFTFNYNLQDYKTILNLGFIAFIKPLHPLLVSQTITSVEFIREAATLIMILAVAYLATNGFKKRFAAFLIIFATWDIFYYVWLKALTGWPGSFFAKDIFFLIPVPWIGPVITPLIISIVMLIVGIFSYIA